MKNSTLYVIIICLTALSIILGVGFVFVIQQIPQPIPENPFDEVLSQNTNYTHDINLILNETDSSLATYHQTGNSTYLSYAYQYLILSLNYQLEYQSWYQFNVSTNPKYTSILPTIFVDLMIIEQQIQFRMITIVSELNK